MSTSSRFGAGHVLIDAGSAGLLARPDLVEILTKRLPSGVTPEGWRAAAREQPVIAEVFMTLEQAIVHEAIVVDQHALRSRGIDPSTVSYLLQPIELPDESYLAAAQAVAVGMKGFIASKNEVLLTQANRGGEPSKDPFWDPELKHWLDHLGNALPYRATREPYDIQDSNESLARALFYLELGDLLNCTIHITRHKQTWLDLLQLHVHQELHRWVSSIVDEALRRRIVEIEATAHSDDSFALPPLADYLLREAAKTGTSLVDVVHKCREQPEACAYRQWLAELEAYDASGRPGQIERAKKLEKLRTLAQEWATYLDTKHKVTHVVRGAHLGKIPKIGWLFEAIGLGDFRLNDPILNKQRDYIYFISRWFDG